MDHSSSPAPSHLLRGRKVLDDSEAARIKREKAAERQRRKRKRDRETIAYAVQSLQQSPVYSPNPNDPSTTLTPATIQQHQQDHHHHHQQHPSAVASSSSSAVQSPVAHYSAGDMMSMEEIRKRDKVRAAARERQRKHRQQVKMRKMRELGLEVAPNEMPPHIEDIYRLNHDGHFQQVLNDLQQQPVPHDPNQMPLPPPDPQLNQGQPPLGGQTFASTLLLSFSCAPLLKQHLLRTLSMTNEELASLEPILAEAWDTWDRNRRMHYAEQAAKAVASVCPPFPVDLSQSNPFPHPLPNGGDPNGPPNEFRERFARSLVAPSPFAPPQHGNSTGAAGGAAGPSGSGDAEDGEDGIDPHLGGGTMNPASPPTTSSTEDSV